MWEVRFAEDDLAFDRARYLVFERFYGLAGAGGMRILRPDGTQYQYEANPGTWTNFAPEDWHSIPLDALAALHASLAQKMRVDGLDDGRALRRDYDAERERVDTLMASVIRIADRASKT